LYSSLPKAVKEYQGSLRRPQLSARASITLLTSSPLVRKMGNSAKAVSCLSGWTPYSARCGEAQLFSNYQPYSCVNGQLIRKCYDI
jgi:hypothetical protein